jgi:hypothetical protein
MKLRQAKGKALPEGFADTNLPSAIDRCDLLVISVADVVTVLPRAMRARKSESLRGKSQSHRKGDTR